MLRKESWLALLLILWSFLRPPLSFRPNSNIIDAFFEVSPALQTGATILDDVGVHSHSPWRSFTHLIGDGKYSASCDYGQWQEQPPWSHEGRGLWSSVWQGRFQIKNIGLNFTSCTWVCSSSLWFFISLACPHDRFCRLRGTAGTGASSSLTMGLPNYNSSLITYLVSIGVLVFWG